MHSMEKSYSLRSYYPQKKRARVRLPNSFGGTVYWMDTLEATAELYDRAAVAGISIADCYFPATSE